ncbi:dispanin subfamily A member 2b-like isoform X1 [Pelodiscus sinensis]|uniref:dispanin subfamily A member 2b-like isoform X1 n=1 Tax=Pelodiscus sinensis TaxID=13735 RepID=UPI003F6B9E79
MEPGPRAVSIDLQPRPGGPKGLEEPAPRGAVPAEQPRDYVLWSLFNTVFFNVCCLGFLALVFSVKARDCKVLGDTSGAGSYGKTARKLNIAALVLGLLALILFIVIGLVLLFQDMLQP